MELEKALRMQSELNNAHLGIFREMLSFIGEMAQDVSTLARLMQTALPVMDFEGHNMAAEIVKKYEDVANKLVVPEDTGNVG